MANSSDIGDRPENRISESETTSEELRDVIEDPGYSADQRKATLKMSLTELEQRTDSASGERRRLVRRIRTTIDNRRSGLRVSNAPDCDDSSI